MENSTRDQYDAWHDRLRQGGAEDHSDSPWHRMVKQHLGSVAGQRVLEIGCGRGGFSAYLLDEGADLVAADFSASAVAATQALLDARRRPGAKAEALQADIQSLPFPDGSFDCVVSLETLEHVPDPERGLAELVRVTRPGGRLCITTPNYLSILGLYRVYRELTGRPFTEEGQPINHPLWLISRVRKLRALGCRVDVVDGCGHYAYVPRRNPIRMHFLDRPRALTKWFAAHSLTLATKLG